MIKLEGVTKTYGRKSVLKNISFEIAEGDFAALVGPSGAGKTTLINALIGAIDVDQGKIIVNGYNVGGLHGGNIQRLRRKVGIIFQDYKLLPKKTVYENIAFALEMNGEHLMQIEKKTSEVLKTVGLEDQRNQLPNTLSGGERQRVAVARALIHAPKVLIADEPTGNLDPENALNLCRLFMKINRENKTTILLSTHNQTLLEMVKPRIIKLKDGKLID